MAAKINRPRPATRLGLASDVRSTDYQKRVKRAVKGVASRTPARARTALPERGR